MINQTANQTMIEIAKASSYSTNLITLYIVSVIALLLCLRGFSTNKSNWGRLMGVWFTTSAITGGFLTLFLMSPESFPNFLIKLKDFFA